MTPEEYIMPEPQEPYFTAADIDGVFPDAKPSKVTHDPPPLLPPHSHDAEVAILGAVLLNNRALSEVRGELTADDFYTTTHRRIYKAMLAIASKNKGIDPVSLGDELMQDDSLERMGGPEALDKLTLAFVEGRSEVGRVRQYAEILRGLTAKRRMIAAAQEIVARGYGDPGNAGEYLEESHSSIAQAARYSTRSGPAKIGVEMKKLFRHLEDNTDPPGLVKTGIDAIDSFTGGLQPGILYAVAGRPGMGKSSLIVNIATNAAISGSNVLFVTLEDVRRFIAMRAAARLADIDLGKIVRKEVSEPDAWRRLVDAVNLTDEIPLWVEDKAGLTSMAIAQIAAAHQATHGLDLLIVDHLGEVADKGESETSITGRAAMKFRDITKDLDIPVILVSQLNRQVENRDDRRPRLSDLRQSGRTEEAARVVWFLYRPAYYTKGDDAARHNDLHLIQAKSSHGRTGVMKLYVDLSRMHVRSWEPVTDGVWPDLDEKGKYKTGF